jgi:hypothetical protein
MASGLAVLCVASFATAQASNHIMPPFSWQTLPVAFHSSSSHSRFSAAQIKEIARYHMVTLEKYSNIAAVVPPSTLSRPYVQGLYECQNGTDLSRCGCCAEDEIVETARLIKAANSKVMIVAYMHSQISYPWYRESRKMVANSSWWLTDAAHAGPTGSTWKNFDLTIAAAADHWKQTALNLTSTGVIDTVFADGCTNKVKGVTPARTAQLYAAKVGMLQSLQSQIPGPIICGSDGEFMPGVGAVQAEGWGVASHKKSHFATIEIPTLMKAVSAGVVYQAHGRALCNQSREHPQCCDVPPCNCTTVRPSYNESAAQTELAAFLVAMGTYSYYLCGSWEDTFSSPMTSTWLPVYDLPLGEPLGNATMDKKGVWRRSFASGTNVTFDTKAEVGRVYWAGGAYSAFS